MERLGSIRVQHKKNLMSYEFLKISSYFIIEWWKNGEMKYLNRRIWRIGGDFLYSADT